MKKIILFLLFFSFVFSEDLIEINYKIKTVENIKNDEIISNVELSLGKNITKSIEMWGYVSPLDSKALGEQKNFSSKPIFGLISWYQGKGNLIVFLNENNEIKIIERDIFESEGDVLSEEEEKEQNNDKEIVAFKNVDNAQILFNMIKQEKKFIFSKSYLIVSASKNYQEALKKAKEAQQKLGIKLNLDNYEYFKTTGLLNDKYTYTRDFYYPRGKNDDGDYVSIEYSSFYEDFTSGFFIVVVSSGKEETLRKKLTEVKKLYKDAYI